MRRSVRSILRISGNGYSKGYFYILIRGDSGMNKLALVAVLSVAVIVAAAAAVTVSWDGHKSTDADPPEPSGDLDAFAWKVFDGVGDGNILVSPLGLYKALGILTNGAGQGTSAETALLKVLGSSDLGAMNAYASVLGDSFETSDMVLVDSSLLKEPGVRIDPNFARIVNDIYGGKVSEADFSGDIGAVREMIRAWVESATHGMISDYESAADAGTAADILDVAYFKGVWEDKFDSSRTTSEAFHDADGSVSEVRMMHKTLERGVQYYSDGKYRGLSISYTSGASMIVVLPADPKDLGILDSWRSESAEYRTAFLKSVESASFDGKVDLSLPKMEMSASYEMEDLFAALGLDMGMEFPEVLDGRTLSVDGGKQQTKIKVDEEGTEAAAVTEITMKATAVLDPIQPVKFRCDVPFVFVLSDGGSAMFVGYLGDAGGMSRCS
jgi:serpin B